MAAEDKCIGRLYLDIKQVKDDINEINNWLGKIGANVNLEKKLSEGIKNALNKMINEAKKAGEETGKAVSDGIEKNKADVALEKLEQKVLAFENKMQAEADKTLAKMEAKAAKEAVAIEKSEERKRIAREKEEKRYQQAWDKINYQERVKKAEEATKQEAAALDTLIKKYQEYYNLESQKIKAVNNGDLDNADIYRARAQAIWEEIAAIEAENPKLAELAGATEQVTKAVRDWQNTANAGQIKSDNIINKQEIENTKQALDSLIQKYQEYYALESQKINAVHRGDIESADIYRERARALWEEIAAIEAANPKLAELAAESDKVNKSVQQWQMTAKQGEISADKMFGLQGIANAKQMYFELTDAIKNYQAASKQGNADDMAMWQAKISAIMQEVTAIQDVVRNSNLEAGVKQQILNLIQQCTTAENQHNAAAAQTAQSTSQIRNNTGDIQSQVTSLMTRMFSLLAVIRTIKSLIQNTVEYVTAYYDKMNEIQIITQKTDEEVAELGRTYREIAEQLNVSSLELAESAVYFTRQGLAADEIEKRLKNVTMYAKTANVEFKDASEIITSVVNSMGLVEQEAEDGRNATQRVADVFLKIGDNAATSGQEIGEAMQKAAASAGAFGVSMEWLAAYIATVSETTRQEARTIGTAFNTIIARLHQIKQSGYNSEDETKVNDIAKALSKVDIVLMDQAGNWRDMEVILQEIAEKWGGLDGKTKSYIATTMAGVKQQNVFLALMNDMSKGIENNSRAFELYGLAVDSAGTAEQKYATWTDSVTAAQERLTVAQEEFYSLLDASVIKDWYNALAGIVNAITDGTQALSGMNIIIPIAVGLVTTLIVAFKSLKVAAEEAGAASIGSFMVESHPLMLIIAAVGAAITILTALGDTLSQSKKRFEEATEAVKKFNQEIDDLQSDKNKLAQMFEDLGGKIKLSKEDLNEYSGLLERIATVSPEAKEVVDQLKNGFIDQETAVKKLNEEIDKYIANTQNMAAMELLKKYNNYQSDNKTLQGMQNWDNSWYGGFTGKEGFASALKHAYDQSNAWDMGPFSGNLMTEKYMANDLFQQIKGWLEDDIPWDSIATYVWRSMFSGDASYNIQEATANEVRNMINDVMTLVSQRMDSMDTAAVQTKLIGMLFNNDGSLRVADVTEAAKVISDFVSAAMDQSFDANTMLTPFERLTGFASSMLGTLTSDMWSELYDIAGDDPEVIEHIARAYEKLIASGMSQADIKDVYANTPISEWADAYANLVEEKATELEQKIRGIYEYSPEGFGIWEDLFGDTLEGDIDLETLALIDSLVEAEVDINKIKEAASDSTDIDSFKKALQALAEAAGVELTYGSDQAVQSVTEVSKAIKKEIKTLDSELDKLRKGKTLTFSELVDLAQAHPEILNFINGPLSELQAKIEEIRTQTLESGKEQLKQALLANEEFVDSIPEGIDPEEYVGILTKALIEYVDEAEEAKDATEDVKTVAASVREVKAEISDYDKVIKNLEGGKGVSFSDLFDIAEKHPEILEIVDDTELLTQKLKDLREEARKSGGDLLKDSILDSEKLMASTQYAGKGKTLREYLDSLEEGAEKDAVNALVEELTKKLNDLVQATEDVEDTADKAKENIKEIKTISSDLKSLDSLYDKVVKNGKATFEDVISFADTHPELLTLIGDTDALLKKIQELKQESLDSLAQNIKNYMLTDEGEAQKYFDAHGISNDSDAMKTLQGYRDWLVATGQDVSELDQYITDAANAMKEGAQAEEEAAETWLEAQMKLAEKNEQVNWAKSNGFSEQVGALQDALDEGGLEQAKAVWDAMIPEMQQAIANEYPNLIKAMGEVEQHLKSEAKDANEAAKAQRNLGKELENITRYNTPTHFEKTNEAIKKLQEGTISAKDAYDIWADEINKVTKAQEDLNDVNQKLSQGKQDEITESDVNNLSNLLGITADQILADFPAVEAMFNALIADTGELKSAFDALNEAAFIRITGTSEADFSNIQNGLLVVNDMAQQTIDLLLATGQWKLDRRELEGEMAVWDENTKSIITKAISGFQDVLVPTNKNPYKGTNATGTRQRTSSNKKNSSGSSGTKNNKANEHPQTEVEMMLNRMSQVQAIQEYQQSYYQAQGNYYNQTGQLQGVIGASQKEIEVLKAQNVVLKQNIDQINVYRKQKEEELKTLNISDEKYEEVRDDLDRLQKAHQEYTKQVIDNETAIDQLNETIKETQRKIRDMVINIKNQIYKAIEDRENKRKNMFENEISMENTILELIKKRYEKERDLILANTDRKITALQEERDLLSEQLELRKKMADQEDKAAKLAQLEANYQRIIADPTRKKEALKIKDQINDLRKEIAWDAAEDEVSAQQEAIDQQITSLEDYKQYVEEYYEDLFAHPQKLIEEMRDIIEMADEDIINWLSENDETFAASTANTQIKMIEGWQQTLDDMHGKIKTYWDEVEQIYQQGDEAIIEFLKENSDEYARASKEQAEKYVDSWLDALDDLHKAMEEPIVITIAENYVVMDNGSGSSGSNSGSGSGSGNGNGTTDHGYSFTYNGKEYTKKGFSSKADAEKAANTLIANMAKSERDANDRNNSKAGTVYEFNNTEIGKRERSAKNSLYAYLKGGLAYNTGLAWLDGTRQDPERVLSPYQTKLFETMIQALERMSTISVPSMPNFGDMPTGNANNVSVGDIIVNVDNLDTDADYDELAEKVSEVLMERIGRTAVVGGLRINA